MYEEEEDLPQLSTEERIRLVSDFIRQAPPGEVNDVINDARLIIGDDSAFNKSVGSAIQEYNHDQFTVIDVPGLEYKTLISSAALLPNGQSRYYEPRSSQSFEFDHISLKASDVQPLDLPEATTSYLSSFEKPLQAYISNHYSNGAGSIFPSLIQIQTPSPSSSEPAPIHDPTPNSQDTIVESPVAEEDTGIASDGASDLVQAVKIGSDVFEALAGAVTQAVESVTQTGEEKIEEKAEGEGEGEQAESSDQKMVDVEQKMEDEPSEDVKSQDLEQEAAPVESLVAPTQEEEKEEQLSAPEETTSAVPLIGTEEGKYTIVTSGHRFSPTNFWTGRWRSSYKIDLSQEIITGRIEAVVHYYEQGNVQLRTVQTPTIALPPAGPSQASAIVSEISKVERLSQEGVNERLEELGDKAFKSLRRALPVTRQKVDWDKVGGYKLGGAIGGAGRGEVEAEV